MLSEVFSYFSKETTMCLNLVWAPVLHTEAYRHRLEWWMIDELLRHSPEHALSQPTLCASRQACQHPNIMYASVIKPDFSPRTRGSEPKLEGGTFSPPLIPSLAMNYQWLSQPRPHRNQSLVYFILKPDLSNLAHLITLVIRHYSHTEQHVSFLSDLRQHSVLQSRVSQWGCAPEPAETNMFLLHIQGTSTALVLSWHQKNVERGNGGIGVCWGMSCRMRHIHTNTNQMEG